MPARGVEARVPFGEVDAADMKRVLSERFPGLAPEVVKAINEQAGRAAAGSK